jgi:hypothetical protein
VPLGGLVTAGVGSVVSGLFGMSAAQSAAKAQAAAALKAQGVADTNKQQGLDTLGSNTTASNTALNNLSTNVNTNTLQANAQYSPYSQVGTTAAGGLNTALQNPFSFNISQDPGYQFRMQQGQQAVEQSAAAAGGATGGAALKALTQYGQGYASNEYQNAFNRNQTQLQNLFQGAGVGMNASNSVSNNLNQGSALQSGIVGQQVGNLTNNSDLTANILGQNTNAASQNYTGAGNAQAAGIVGQANALTGAVNGLGQTANQAFLMNLLQGGGAGQESSALNQLNSGPIPSPYE